jgi:RHS repeat-associated protein
LLRLIAVYRDLAMYYDVQGRLVIALWDSWEIEKGDVVNYAREKAVEFRYDNTDARQRYMMRALDEAELPDIVPLASPLGQWVEYSGSAPFLDAEYEHADDMTYAATREYDPTVEREVGGGADELHLHGDLIGSTIAATDEDEVVAGRQVYTAFGEPVGTPTLSGTRYRYAGAFGYEEGLLTLDGAMGTEPIVLLHLGERWYQPGIGRFVQRDPIGLMGGANCYLYAGANPIALIDPSGRNPIDDVNDFIARNFWQRIFSEDYLANMTDGEMYAWGIGVSVAGGVAGGACMIALEGTSGSIGVGMRGWTMMTRGADGIWKTTSKGIPRIKVPIGPPSRSINIPVRNPNTPNIGSPACPGCWFEAIRDIFRGL